jgi:tripartite ATP-independent transporter DctP family solute receptor
MEGEIMKIQVLFSRLLAVCFLLILAVPLAGAETILKFSHTDNPDGLRDQAAKLFAQKVEQYTQGRYKVRVFPSGQLANDPKAIEQLQLGGIDFTVSATGSYATHLRTLNLTALPFLVDNYEQGWKFYDESKWLQKQFSLLPPKGFRYLATFEAGFRCFSTKMPLNSPADAKGRKMRIYPNDMIRWIMEDIGFSPVVLPVTEVYLAIQQGTVDGQENPIDTIYSLRFYEVAKYITMTNHIYSPIPLTISEITWSKFSEADKAAVKKAAVEAAQWSRNAVKQAEGGQLKDMQSKGAIVTRPNIEPFRVASKPVYDKAKAIYGADVDQILADAKTVREAKPVSESKPVGGKKRPAPAK